MFFLKNIQKEKELIDRELEVYKNEQLALITLDIARAQEKGALEEREYECTWHNRRQELETQLASLEAKKESYTSLLEERNRDYVQEYHAVINAKDQTIRALQDSLTALIAKFPITVSQTINQ